MSSPTAERWVLATGNAGKLREFAALLDGLALELVSLGELGITGPDEPAPTFVENALLKARHASRATGLPALADDSGLVVPALGGAPGVRSARYAGEDASDAMNNARLLGALADLAGADRKAAFVCVAVALRTPDDPLPLIATGRWDGSIAPEPRGTGGFGYDPVFIDTVSGRTAAELTSAEKNACSHRGRAVSALAATLATNLARRPG